MAKTREPLVSSSGGQGTKKKKNKSKSRPNSVAMKVKPPKSNPFETIRSHRKFDILGKKRKGEERRTGLARSLAIEKRKKTLLKDYERSGKASVFVDKRIGEDKEGMEEFEKAILRSQREYKLKWNKRSKYNLPEEEEDDLEDGRRAFMEKDDFEDEMLPDDDEDGSDADGVESYRKRSAVLKQLASPGADPHDSDEREGWENRHKSKKEVMEEIIFKSKLFKAQKAKDKEENEQLMEELDKNFTSLVQSDVLLSLTEPGKMNALRALVNKSIPKENLKSSDLPSTDRAENNVQEKPDTYEKLVKEMSLDIRARPSDRTKTPEEIAQEERERLEQLEEERKKRMLASDDYSDEDDEDGEKQSAKQVRSISGDDLGDSFSLDEETQIKRGWVDEILEREAADNFEDSSEELDSAEDDSGSDNDEDDSAETYHLKDWEQSDDEKLDADLEEEEEEEEECNEKSIKSEKNADVRKVRQKIADISAGGKLEANSKPITTPSSSLPFLIEAPKCLEELNVLLESRSNCDIILLISRIRAGNAIALAAENRKKMQVFYGVLLQYFASLASNKPLQFELLNMLVKPLIEMSMEIPYFAAICARQRILRTRTQFCEVIKNSEVSGWPSLKTLFLLRLWSMIFPCSDFRHVVMTPAMLLMSEYLIRCPILSGRDIALGCFLCSMVLSVTKQSMKFCPEAIMFLKTLLFAASDRKTLPSQNSHLLEFRVPKDLLCMHEGVTETSPLNLLRIMDMPEDSPFFSSDNFRASILTSAIGILEGFMSIYGKLSSFSEIFLPISNLLLNVAQQKNMPDELCHKLKDAAEVIKMKADEHRMLRQPLQMRKQKPVPIKQLNPKFEENFVKGRDYDPDRERAKRKMLKKLVKQEAKGAVRELQKDNYFLFDVKQRDKLLQEQERAEKYGRARAFLQEQAHAFKSGQLGKGRKRRR